MNAPPPPNRVDPESASIGALLGNVSHDLSDLVRQELALARAELRREAVRTGKGASALGAAVLAGQLAVLSGSVALGLWLSRLTRPEWAALVVALAWAAGAVVLYLNGTWLLGTARLDRPPRPGRATAPLNGVDPVEGDHVR